MNLNFLWLFINFHYNIYIMFAIFLISLQNEGEILWFYRNFHLKKISNRLCEPGDS